MDTLLACLYAFIVACTLLQPIKTSGQQPLWNRAEFERQVLLVQISEGSFGPGDVETLEEEAKRKLTDVEKSIFSGTDEGAWRMFEDDLVQFEIPDHPELKIEVVTPKSRKRIGIVGGAVGTTDNHFQRAYRMTVNDLPFGVLLLSESEWFDDGICLCGPIVHKQLVLDAGTLLEFSLLPGGRVKKVQALGAEHRAILFEWTHSALTAERYQRIGSSIRLKKASARSEQEWMALEKKHRDEVGWQSLGWLKRDDSTDRVRSLMGEPTRREKDDWVYEKERWEDDGSGRLVSLHLRVVDEKFDGFPSRLWDSRDLPPRQGSTAWAEQIVQKLPEAPKDTTGLPSEVREVYDQFKKQASASPAWNKWCQIAHEMKEKGYRDASVKAIVDSRFLETKVEQHYSAWLLDDYASEDTEAIFRKRVRLVLDDCKTNRDKPITDPDEVWNLFSFMKLKEEASLALLREAVAHPHDTVRGSAFGQAKSLPREEARALAKKAALAETDEHCLTMIAYLIRDVGAHDDLVWWESAKPRFGTKELSEVWNEAATALRKSSGKQ